MILIYNSPQWVQEIESWKKLAKYTKNYILNREVYF